jgi:predicted TIM-barrel fold metal-dependent hydrolase
MIIDAHHHIWLRKDVPWLLGPQVPRIFGAYGALQRDYTVEEFIADIDEAQVTKSVYVQANWAPERCEDEVAWVQSIAERHGFPHGIIGYADLCAPDVGDMLDRMGRHAGFRGVRQQIHWHEKALYRFASRPDLMDDPQWRRGMGEVERRGLLFELQVFASQMADSVRLVRDFPGVTFVLLHVGMLDDRSSNGIADWKKGLAGLAACPNVVTKLSGLGTFDRACSVESWRTPVQTTLDLFGPSRCLYGSNFPIEKLWTTYGQVVSTMTALLAGLTPLEHQAVMHDNAARLYRI